MHDSSHSDAGRCAKIRKRDRIMAFAQKPIELARGKQDNQYSKDFFKQVALGVLEGDDSREEPDPHGGQNGAKQHRMVHVAVMVGRQVKVYNNIQGHQHRQQDIDGVQVNSQGQGQDRAAEARHGLGRKGYQHNYRQPDQVTIHGIHEDHRGRNLSSKASQTKHLDRLSADQLVSSRITFLPPLESFNLKISKRR